MCMFRCVCVFGLHFKRNIEYWKDGEGLRFSKPWNFGIRDVMRKIYKNFTEVDALTCGTRCWAADEADCASGPLPSVGHKASDHLALSARHLCRSHPLSNSVPMCSSLIENVALSLSLSLSLRLARITHIHIYTYHYTELLDRLHCITNLHFHNQDPPARASWVGLLLPSLPSEPQPRMFSQASGFCRLPSGVCHQSPVNVE